MSNTLPRDTQKLVGRMYRARLFVAGSLVAITTALFAALALSPMYLALHAGQYSAPVSAPEVKSAEIQKERAEITRTQSLVAALAPFTASTTKPSEAIGLALSLRPKGVLVDHISYSPGTSGEIMIVGFSPARDAVNLYRQALQADARFKTVSVPVGDLAGTQGGKFSVTLLGDF